jgi:hypothetical protein
MKRTIRLRCLLSSSALALFVVWCGGATRQIAERLAGDIPGTDGSALAVSRRGMDK